MRIRTVKPEFWRSEDITSLPRDLRLLFIGIWSYVDDNGVGLDRLSTIAADLFADDLARDPRDTLAWVSEGLLKLSEAGLIGRYEVDGRTYLHVVAWHHQKIDHPAKARYPGPVTSTNTPIPEILAQPSRGSSETVAPVAVEQGSSGAEEQGKKNPPASQGPPTPGSPRGSRLPEDWRPDPDLVAWTVREFPSIDGRAETERFRDHWRSKPGAAGRKLDWSATFRNWIREAYERASRNRPARSPTTTDDRVQAGIDLSRRLAEKPSLELIS